MPRGRRTEGRTNREYTWEFGFSKTLRPGGLHHHTISRIKFKVQDSCKASKARVLLPREDVGGTERMQEPPAGEGQSGSQGPARAQAAWSHGACPRHSNSSGSGD